MLIEMVKYIVLMMMGGFFVLEFDEFVKSVIGEMVNMIMGNILILFL